MNDIGGRPPDDQGDGGPRDDGAEDEARHWQAVARLRQQRPGWVIIWLPHIRSFRARPLFRAPRGTALTAATTGEMEAQMDLVEEAARRPRPRSRPADT